ncbi:GrpB family protein [uncultured Microbacterium sp.]|uniref:GrpB family protein n=1 Tax=uncultured Microbacterium sp. TaxID=191216 RepID=UPI002609F6C0|nr:GrpB family protein [uncultured Microbacterium sp.]
MNDDGTAVILVSGKDAEWHARFESLAARIHSLAPGARIAHIGSTAVPAYEAKDVVDVLVGVPREQIAVVSRVHKNAGFDEEGCRDRHAWLSVPSRGAREAVVHVVEAGGEQWRRRLAFRDLLRSDAAARHRYLEVKRQSAATATGWGAYTAGKSDIVAALLAGISTDESAHDAAG